MHEQNDFRFQLFVDVLFQVAGLPTNIAFLHMLSNHWAFDKGLVETHFIEHFKADFFPDEVPVETDVAAKLSATIVAACICEMDYTTLRKTIPGMLTLSSLMCRFAVLWFFNLILVGGYRREQLTSTVV